MMTATRLSGAAKARARTSPNILRMAVFVSIAPTFAYKRPQVGIAPVGTQRRSSRHKKANIIKGVLNLTGHLSVLEALSESKNHHFLVELPVNPRDVSETCSG